MNYLVITFADGKQFSISVKILAKDIAKYFADHHRDPTYAKAFDAEFNYYRSNPEFLIPWASDMPWKKIRPLLGLYGIPTPVIKGYRAEWGNAYKEIKDL